MTEDYGKLESLFGVKDFVKLTISEFAKLVNRLYDKLCGTQQTELDDVEQLFGFEMFLKRHPRDNENREIERMMNLAITDIGHKYGVKIEIKYSPLRHCMIDVNINVWVDGFLMIPTSWWTCFPHDCRILSGLYYIDEAHKKYLHSLHYAEFKANMDRITEELISTAMHPRRLIRHLELGGEIEDF